MIQPQRQLMLFALRGASPTAEEVEIVVYDVIGKNWLGDGVNASDVITKLQAAPKAKSIKLRVNSRGGILDEAKAMVNLLHEKAAAGVSIVGYVDGIAASSASYLLTAATKVIMPSNAFQMVHQVRAGLGGTAGDLEAAAALMRRNNTQLAEAYAAAGARRGKAKSAADFLAAFEAGDLYLDADQAIEWGLADQKLEALKMVACLADISADKDVPPLLLNAPYVATGPDDPRLVALVASLEPPASPAPPPQPQPTNAGPGAQPSLPNIEARNIPMTISKVILTALALSEDADEAAVVSAVTKLRASAKLGTDIEQLVGASGSAALGVVRALQEERESNSTLAGEVAQLKVINARRAFDAARDAGLKDKKLTPATAKLYTDRFENAIKDEAAADPSIKAQEIADELTGFLKVAPRIVNTTIRQPSDANPSEDGPILHNGKKFEELKPMDQKRLKDANPDLYNSMREDAQARGAI